MAKLERVYNIPLRKEYLNVPPHRRAKRCIVAIRKFLGRHMHSEDVRLGTVLNEYIWHHGMKFPPHHVQVEAVRGDDGMVFAELVGATKKEAKTSIKAKKPEHKEHPEHEGHKHEEKKEEKPKTEKKEAPKKEHKEEKPKAEKKPAKKKE